MTKNQKKKAKANHAAMFGLLPHQIKVYRVMYLQAAEAKSFCVDQPIEYATMCVPSISLAACGSQTVNYTPITTTKEHDMAYNSNNISVKAEEVDASRAYALDNLNGLRHEKMDLLRVKYFIDRPRPKTWEEAFKWFSDGYYTLSYELTPESAKARYSYGFFDYILWGDKKADEEGFKKAADDLETAYTSSRDIIAVKSDENERLKALQDFRNYTIH